MGFSFFKKQSTKGPESEAVRSRPDALPSGPVPATAEEAVPLPETVAADLPVGADDFDLSTTVANLPCIDVDHDDDPLQAVIEQAVVLYANGQTAAARSLLESFVHSYRGDEGRRLWLLLFDLLQLTGDRIAFEQLGMAYIDACETSPPAWQADVAQPVAAVSSGPQKIALQGVLTAENAGALDELARVIAGKGAVVIDCGRLVGCDDEIAGQWADLLEQARRKRLALTLSGIETFIGRLNDRLVTGQASHQGAWRLLLALLQRHAPQAVFEEKAVDYAVTFEVSPPSWEPAPAGELPTAAANTPPGDTAHYLAGELKHCRFEALESVLAASERPVLDFSGVRRLDFFSAGQLVNRIAPYQAQGKEVIIRGPNHLVAELMAVVGLDRLARIIVPKS